MFMIQKIEFHICRSRGNEDYRVLTFVKTFAHAEFNKELQITTTSGIGIRCIVKLHDV